MDAGLRARARAASRQLGFLGRPALDPGAPAARGGGALNLLVLAALAALAFALIWAGQSVVLWRIGEPLAWPLRFETPHRAPRLAARVLVPAAWVLVVAGFGLIQAVGRAAGWIRPFREHPPAKLRRKLLRRIFVVPVPAALIEELVFRCLLLEQLLVALPPTTAGRLGALAVSSAVFSSVHFVAPKPPGEPVWQAARGLFFVGCAIGAGYVCGGRTLWLALAIHAAGIASVEVPRLLTRYERRGHWLVGTREFPHSGLLGIALMSLLAGVLLRG